MNIQVLGLLIIGGVLALGFLSLGIYMYFDKTPRIYIRKPSSQLNNKK
jgi:hypothetical protein